MKWPSRPWNVRFSAGVAVLAVATGLFLATWWPALTGDRVLIGGDILYGCCLPWQAESAAHQPVNPVVSDPVLQFLPWQQLTAQAFRQGRLPLWDSYALTGKPLLANDQSAPFSPFTWLALPFAPARGLTLAMLAKLWLAGIGMAVFLRILGARGLPAVAGGIAYACSSFMVVWLAWPHSAVAAILPWAFAAAERYLSGGGRVAQVWLAIAVALQFLAGHAETSLHLGFGLALYCAVRWLAGARSWRPLVGLAVAAILGTALAAIQLLPFLQELQGSTLVADRAASQAGVGHLSLSAVSSWLVPNGHGNPALDGLLGRPPNYSESTGFAGVAMLTLAPFGLAWLWKRQRSRAAALLVPGVVAAGVIYGPLAPFVGRLPGLSVSANPRMLVLLCFVVVAFGGLGLEAIWARDRVVLRGAQLLGLGAGVAGAAGVGVGAALLLERGGRAVAAMWQPLYGYETFWVVLAALTLVSAVGFVTAGLIGGGGRSAATGLVALILLEAFLFAVPFEPLVPPQEVPPPSLVTSWLQGHAGDAPIAAVGTILVPDSLTLYGLHDVRTYDVVRSSRSRTYWQAGDPGYHDELLYSLLEAPGSEWLARAGVRYVVTQKGGERPGTVPVFSVDGVTVAEVPGARPFAFSAASWSSAATTVQARNLLVADPRRSPVLERAPRAPSFTSAKPGTVVVTSREPEAIALDVTAPSEEAVLVLQSYSPDWKASIDGRAAALYPADVLFQAVVVSAGRHLIELRYRPTSVALGAGLTGAALAAIILILIVNLVPRLAHRGGATEGSWRVLPRPRAGPQSDQL